MKKKLFDFNSAKVLDAQDELSVYRNNFNIPQFNKQDAIYFTGNSLGLQLKNYDTYLKQEMEDWKTMGVEGHFDAKTPWVNYHQSLEQGTSRLVGAKINEVVTMNGLSVNLHLLFTSFYQPTKKKYKILCESHLFPSDLYIIQSQIQLNGFDPDDAIIFIPSDSNGVVDEEKLYSLIDNHKDDLALIFMGGVNYYTGQVFNIAQITKIGHQNNIVVGFDLAHAAGNIELKLHEWKVDFAAWCSYKYLNAGPGNVSTIFIHEKQIAKKPFRLSGWWGHQLKNRFVIQERFEPVNTAEGWQLSNAPVLGMSVYRASIDLFDKIGMAKLILKRNQLTMYLEQAVEDFNNISSLNLKIITPGISEERGSQLSIFIDKNGQKIYNHLRSNGVFLDWREPNVMRMAPVPLYNSFNDIARFHQILMKCI
ncbi:MAG: kynureninase [Flavobacteriales bacterium]|nr:kynureninase [Flavobacteriales bacterium]|tara:strand:+ start:301 stop:1566 length:1266 start_codon:yes stop_codon:yes gene_type:complete